MPPKKLIPLKWDLLSEGLSVVVGIWVVVGFCVVVGILVVVGFFVLVGLLVVVCFWVVVGLLVVVGFWVVVGLLVVVGFRVVVGLLVVVGFSVVVGLLVVVGFCVVVGLLVVVGFQVVVGLLVVVGLWVVVGFCVVVGLCVVVDFRVVVVGFILVENVWSSLNPGHFMAAEITSLWFENFIVLWTHLFPVRKKNWKFFDGKKVLTLMCVGFFFGKIIILLTWFVIVYNITAWWSMMNTRETIVIKFRALHSIGIYPSNVDWYQNGKSYN